MGAILASLLLLLGVAGCQPSQPGAEQTLTAPASSPAATGQETTAKAVREDSGKITVTDYTGRTVTLDGPADKVFGAGPPATAILYTYDPSVMAGWNMPLSERQLPYVDPAARELPVLGRVTGGKDTFDPEALITHHVDLVLEAGEVSEKYAKSSQELQEKSGVPVIQVSSDPREMANVYEMLGVITGNEARAKELAAETRRITAQVTEKAATIPEAERVSVYYATGDDGLQTTKGGSIHSHVIEIVGAKNALGQGEKTPGREEIDAEAVIKADPDWVIVNISGKATELAANPTEDPHLGGLRAFKNGTWLVAPYAMYGWFDGPPSVNQTLGLVWLAECLYPETYDFDVVQETISFYKTFYRADLTEEQARKLLTDARTPGVQ